MMRIEDLANYNAVTKYLFPLFAIIWYRNVAKKNDFYELKRSINWIKQII